MKVDCVVLAVFMAAVFLASGCITLEVNEVIHSDGIMEYTTVIDFSGMMEAQEALNGMVPDTNQDANVQVTTPTQDTEKEIQDSLEETCSTFLEKTPKEEEPGCEIQGYKAVITGKTVLDEPVFEVRNSIPYTFYKYNIVKTLEGVSRLGEEETFSLPSVEEAEQAKAMAKLMGMSLSYSLEMPGKIVKADAGEVRDNRLELDLFDLAGRENAYVESRELNWLMTIVALIVVIALAAGVIVVVLLKKKSRPRVPKPLSFK